MENPCGRSVCVVICCLKTLHLLSSTPAIYYVLPFCCVTYMRAYHPEEQKVSVREQRQQEPEERGLKCTKSEQEIRKLRTENKMQEREEEREGWRGRCEASMGGQVGRVTEIRSVNILEGCGVALETM